VHWPVRLFHLLGFSPFFCHESHLYTLPTYPFLGVLAFFKPTAFFDYVSLPLNTPMSFFRWYIGAQSLNVSEKFAFSIVSSAFAISVTQFLALRSSACLRSFHVFIHFLKSLAPSFPLFCCFCPFSKALVYFSFPKGANQVSTPSNSRGWVFAFRIPLSPHVSLLEEVDRFSSGLFPKGLWSFAFIG